jgi:predicted PurR-regulated permease PerM
MALLPESIRKNNILVTLLVLLVLVIAWYLRVLFLYIAIAAILTMIVRPLDKTLERVRVRKKKIPRSLRALIQLLSIYVVVFAFIAIFIPVIIDEATIISNIDGKEISTALHEPLSELETAFAKMQKPGAQQQSLEQYISKASSDLISFTEVSSFANTLAAAVTQIFVGFFAISFFTFFFIKDGSIIFEMMMLLFPARHNKSVRNVFDDTRVMLTKYFTGVLIDVVFVATFVSLGMWMLGIRNAVIIGVFAGVMNIIPYVGTLISGAFAIIIAASTNLALEFYTGMLPLLGKVLLVFILMNLVDAFLVQPFIFSKRVKAHPIEIFAVILVAGTLAGVGGMIVAVPVYTVFRLIAREFLTKSQFVRRLTDEMDESTSVVPVAVKIPEDSL